MPNLYLYRSVQYRYLSTVCVYLASMNMVTVVDVVVQNPQKRNEYEYENKTCTSWLQDVLLLLLLSFLLWCSDD